MFLKVNIGVELLFQITVSVFDFTLHQRWHID